MLQTKLEEEYNFSVIGIDEAGRGPWAGPVVAAAILYSNKLPEGINDSKKLSETKRNYLFEKLTDNFSFGIGIACNQEIDSLNILNATKLAMKRAYENLGIKSQMVLVDGNFIPDLENQPSKFIIGGDAKSITIAAASIIAKVYRDKLMEEFHEKYPMYQWNKNKGYGTASHIFALEKYGVCELHRKSFKPIKNFINLISSINQLSFEDSTS